MLLVRLPPPAPAGTFRGAARTALAMLALIARKRLNFDPRPAPAGPVRARPAPVIRALRERRAVEPLPRAVQGGRHAACAGS